MGSPCARSAPHRPSPDDAHWSSRGQQTFPPEDQLCSCNTKAATGGPCPARVGTVRWHRRFRQAAAQTWAAGHPSPAPRSWDRESGACVSNRPPLLLRPHFPSLSSKLSHRLGRICACSQPAAPGGTPDAPSSASHTAGVGGWLQGAGAKLEMTRVWGGDLSAGHRPLPEAKWKTQKPVSLGPGETSVCCCSLTCCSWRV